MIVELASAVESRQEKHQLTTNKHRCHTGIVSHGWRIVVDLMSMHYQSAAFCSFTSLTASGLAQGSSNAQVVGHGSTQHFVSRLLVFLEKL